MTRKSDNRLRTICEFCRQWVRVGPEDINWVVRHHSQPQGGVCIGSGAQVEWTIPKSFTTRGRPGVSPGEEE